MRDLKAMFLDHHHHHCSSAVGDMTRSKCKYLSGLSTVVAAGDDRRPNVLVPVNYMDYYKNGLPVGNMGYQLVIFLILQPL